ncbi:MAG: L,D-transpeptidase family protein [Victivallales bacterium]|nr:L,D-transpeptidase family protein [Victivallales bacterium]
MRRINRWAVRAALILLIISGIGFWQFGRSIWVPVYFRIVGRRTVEDVIGLYGSKVDAKLQPLFARVGVQYPPAGLTLIGLKEEKRLEVWAPVLDKWIFITDYPISGTSGKTGPKLREGDGQVPEGMYGITGLNPNSSYHLSLKIDYPNSFDREKANKEKRRNPGGNIFIHGKNASIGCLAMGDDTIEELFVLAHKVGCSNIQVLIAPMDLRIKPAPMISSPDWVAGLHTAIKSRLADFQRVK